MGRVPGAQGCGHPAPLGIGVVCLLVLLVARGAEGAWEAPLGWRKDAETPVSEACQPEEEAGKEKNQQAATPPRPGVCWPAALRKVRAWLEPWLMLARYWRAWSLSHPPPELQALLTWVQRGFPLYFYEPP